MVTKVRGGFYTQSISQSDGANLERGSSCSILYFWVKSTPSRLMIKLLAIRSSIASVTSFLNRYFPLSSRSQRSRVLSRRFEIARFFTPPLIFLQIQHQVFPAFPKTLARSKSTSVHLDCSHGHSPPGCLQSIYSSPRPAGRHISIIFSPSSLRLVSSWATAAFKLVFKPLRSISTIQSFPSTIS